jgi:DNA-binding transcriptional regulator YhcF (GntR family)
VIPFRVQFRQGESIYEQVIYFAKKAIVFGNLRPGDSFPSVRTLSRELKINPNTAHKIVTYLVDSGLLQAKPGVGTVVATLPEASAPQRAELMGREIEELVVEAKRLGLELRDLTSSLSEKWKRLEGSKKR